MAPDHLFIEFINFGTLLALLIYFRRRIVEICRDVLINRNFVLARNILITAIPAGAIGFFLSDLIETSPFFSSLTVVTITLAVVGAVMVLIDKLPKASPKEHGQNLSPTRAFWIGLAQVLALIPGVSRSGSTIIAGRVAGLSAAAAAEYSFLVALPIMIGVSIKLLVKSGDRAYLLEHLPILLLSNAVAFISGLIAVGFLMKYLSKHGLAIFGWYRLGLAAILTVVLLIK